MNISVNNLLPQLLPSFGCFVAKAAIKAQQSKIMTLRSDGSTASAGDFSTGNKKIINASTGLTANIPVAVRPLHFFILVEKKMGLYMDGNIV